MNKFLLAVLLSMGLASSGLAFHSGFSKPDGTSAFSEAFYKDYRRANEQVDKIKSADPMIDLLGVYKNPEEVAEIYLTIGLIFNQRTGLVDPQKAVLAFTAALQYRFNEDVYMEILLWRAGSYEQLKDYEAAVKDCLRGLLLCSYYDLKVTWPQVDQLEGGRNRSEGDEMKRIDQSSDERVFREKTHMIRKLLMWRYYYLDVVQRLQKTSSLSAGQIQAWLKLFSSDPDRIRRVMDMIAGPNPLPEKIKW